MNRQVILKGVICLHLLFFVCFANASESLDPLPSWNEGKVKQALLTFVSKVSDPHSKAYLPTEDRIATLDNDGTLWVEKPVYAQLSFALDRLKSLAAENPELRHKPPYSTLLSGNKQAIAKLKAEDYEQLILATQSGMSVEKFSELVRKWLATAKDQRYQRLHTELVYQPMLEVVHYLRENGFKVYIVSGGGQDFMRSFSQKVYGVPPEQVIGTAFKTQYTNSEGKSLLLRAPALLLVSDNGGKPEAIHLFIGKKPVIAIGNSTGDRQMLEWTQSSKGPHLMLLVHHDDEKREYAYDTQSKIGRFSKSLMREAEQQNWQIISMKNDWNTIFPFDKH